MNAIMPRHPIVAALPLGVFVGAAAAAVRVMETRPIAPQCLQTTAASWISSAQKGQVFIVKTFCSLHEKGTTRSRARGPGFGDQTSRR